MPSRTRCLWIGGGLLAALGLVSASLWLWLVLSPRPPLLDGIDFSPLILDRHGAVLRIGLTDDEKFRVRVRLGAIAPEAVRATLLYEDRHFRRHPGVNPLALLRSGLTMLGGGRRMGGSTLTMQVARLRGGLVTSTLRGKLVQMLHALRLEWHYSKDEILEAYFTLAPYGANVEGIGAAARVWFQADPARLSHSESLALAPVPQNPVQRSPLDGKDFDAARQRLRELWLAEERRLVPAALAVPSATSAPDAVPAARPLAPVPPATTSPAHSALPVVSAVAAPSPGPTLPPLRVHSPAHLPFAAPHLSTELLPQTRHLGRDRTLRSFIDSAQQRLLERQLAAFAARGRRYGLSNAAAMLIHWPSMEVRALAGSAAFHNPDIAGQVDGTQARRSPGSTLKPFIYALALDQGAIHPQTLLADTPRSFGGYDPENFDRRFRGPLPAAEALRASRNLPAIQLAARLRPGLYAFLRRAEVRFQFSEEHYGLSLVLGGAEVSMRELGTLYAMLANKGVWQPLRLHRDETALPPPRALLSPEAAFVTLRMLESPDWVLPSRSRSLPLRLKTGTSNGFRDAWTAGIVGPYVLVVWVGNFDNSPNAHLVGTQTALPLFGDLARALSLRETLPDLVAAQEPELNLIQIPVCAATGDLDTSLCPETAPTLFIPGRSPTRPSGVFRRIHVDRASGLRLCRPTPGVSEEKVWEFWPSDLQAIFLRAGIVKAPPPPFAPEAAADPLCAADIPPGLPPRILVPKEGVVYQRRLADPQRSAIPLSASLDADASAVFWFDRDRFLGHSPADAPLLWQPEDGVRELRAVDNLGRASVRRVVVETLP